ncbi:MAG: LSU ribosomal protein L10p (P0) [Ignavibacteriae bacterium]|nr:MAG: LSU ribosomal protein L10p (P0) [Ignavibacteriota bacterium]
MQRNEKSKIIEELKEKVSKASGMYLADFTGITVQQVNELRKELYKAGIEYRVVKNTLLKKALESLSGYEKMYDKLVGPTAIAFGYDDPIIAAKMLKKFSEKNNVLKVKACVIENQVYDGSELSNIANMPSRPEMISSIIGSIQAPISGLVGAINAVMRDLVNVLDAIEKKKAA